MKKRGQFYLAGAIILVGVLLSFGVVYSKVSASESDINIEYLAKEIKYEVSRVVDYSVINNIDSLNDNVKDLVGNYSELNPDKDIAVVYGNMGNNMNTIYYVGGVVDARASLSTAFSNPILTITVDGISTEGTMNKGYNVFVLVKKERGEDKYVAFE